MSWAMCLFISWELFTLTAACSGCRSLRQAPKGDFHMLALLPDRIGLSRSWVPLFGIASPLTCVLFCRICLVLFVNYSRLSSLVGPGLGAPLNSYLEGALYKCHRWRIDRH